jgi:hypothetical protein
MADSTPHTVNVLMARAAPGGLVAALARFDLDRAEAEQKRSSAAAPLISGRVQ